MGLDMEPRIVGRFREGDMSHCFGDISKARRILGYAPGVTSEDGVSDLLRWVEQQESLDLIDQAVLELDQRRLTK
jgi:dTDP-L-rhamnose 4-epimerase